MKRRNVFKSLGLLGLVPVLGFKEKEFSRENYPEEFLFMELSLPSYIGLHMTVSTPSGVEGFDPSYVNSKYGVYYPKRLVNHKRQIKLLYWDHPYEKGPVKRVICDMQLNAGDIVESVDLSKREITIICDDEHYSQELY